MPRTERRRVLLILLVALQIVVLGGMAFTYAAAGWYGQQIVLKTAPVDPRDLFYGDYVILEYEISRLDVALWTGGTGLPDARDTVYVKLRRTSGGEGVYEAVEVSPSRPEADENEAVLKGKVTYTGFNAIQVRYGLERYYVQEGTGRALEEQREDMLVSVRIAPWGQARLMDLILP
ncbi:GDYXXLXY domain-containing protein [Paenibacillus sp. 1P07SE]|uniref:GDYXXLXY domain-containing protein n=1 Tax=Paenibacillus sp. 1P07SE TaxID=3132209 RepID=UPI0039A6B1AB